MLVSSASIIKYHKLGVLNNRNDLCHSSEGYNSEITVLVGLFLSEGFQGEFFPASRPYSEDLLEDLEFISFC